MDWTGQRYWARRPLLPVPPCRVQMELCIRKNECLSTGKMLMAAVAYGLCRPGSVNQPPPRTALQKGAVCDRAQTPGSLAGSCWWHHWAPSPTAQRGCLTGEPLVVFPLHSSPFSLSQSHAIIPHFAPTGCAGAEGLGITPFSFTALLSRTARLVLAFQCSWVCCISSDFNTYFPKQR